MDSNKSPRERAEQFCEAWFDQGARASWCPKMVDELAAALALPALGWTIAKPVVEGHYWYMDRHQEPTIYHIVKTERGLCVEQNYGSEALPVGLYHNSHWAGPLVHPTEMQRPLEVPT